MKNWFHLPFLLLLIGCNSTNPLVKALSSKNEKIKKVTDNLDKYEVQIKFTEIVRKNNTVKFLDYEFQVDDSTYFYPASAVKLPITILALEKVNYFDYDRNTPFKVAGDSKYTTVAKEITKIFAVSDNEAYNRFYEFLTRTQINTKLKNKGINAQINHRLSTDRAFSVYHADVHFVDKKFGEIMHEGNRSRLLKPLQIKSLKKGKGYIKKDSLIKEPMDFSEKNYLPISSLHDIMKRLIFPEKFAKPKRFNISEDDRQFLLNTMKILPRNAGYNSSKYYDGYVKFFIIGDTKEQIPKHIEIYNKVGYAYGYLTDCAYIINKKTNKEFIITATVHVNENQIFNDNIYEYDSIGIPFLAELGRQLTK